MARKFPGRSTSLSYTGYRPSLQIEALIITLKRDKPYRRARKIPTLLTIAPREMNALICEGFPIDARSRRGGL